MLQGYDHGYYFISTFIGDHIAYHARFLNPWTPSINYRLTAALPSPLVIPDVPVLTLEPLLLSQVYSWNIVVCTVCQVPTLLRRPYWRFPTTTNADYKCLLSTTSGFSFCLIRCGVSVLVTNICFLLKKSVHKFVCYQAICCPVCDNLMLDISAAHAMILVIVALLLFFCIMLLCHHFPPVNAAFGNVLQYS